jgi:solute carrier family 25 uncoupling protein 27
MYKGTVDCFQQTVQKEGFLSLWKGLGPAYFRCAPWSMTFFITYEQLRKATGQEKYCA